MADHAKHHARSRLWADSQQVESRVKDATTRLMRAMRGPLQNEGSWPMSDEDLVEWEASVKARYADLGMILGEASTMFDRIKAG